MSLSSFSPSLGLVLSGGGARGAYQVGVLWAVAQILQDAGIERKFDVISGVSAGAINAAFMASMAHDLQTGTKKLCDLWNHLTADHVFYTDALQMGKIGLKWMGELSFGGLTGTTPGRALLDTTPLRHLLDENINFHQIQKNLEEGHLQSLAITAIDYLDSTAITFVQSLNPEKAWKKPRKISEPSTIRTDHILASSAIPLLFPPVEVDSRYFGDGCVRNSHPCGPCIYLGAEKLLIVGVRSQHANTTQIKKLRQAPSVARVLNVLLNAVLLDGIELDVERLKRVNDFIRQIPSEHNQGLTYRPINFSWISPSVDIGELAASKAHRLPRLIRYLLKGLGNLEEANEIISYLLFDPDFCSQLIEIGFNDGLRAREELIEILK